MARVHCAFAAVQAIRALAAHAFVPTLSRRARDRYARVRDRRELSTPVNAAGAAPPGAPPVRQKPPVVRARDWSAPRHRTSTGQRVPRRQSIGERRAHRHSVSQTKDQEGSSYAAHISQASSRFSRACERAFGGTSRPMRFQTSSRSSIARRVRSRTASSMST